MIQYPDAIASEEAVFEQVLEAGATNIESNAMNYDIYCAPEDLNTVREALVQRYGDTRKLLALLGILKIRYV